MSAESLVNFLAELISVVMIGGCIGIVNYLGAFNAGIAALARVSKGREELIIVVVCSLIALGGTTFGMAEETIAFYPILIPIFLSAGYDAMVGIAAIYAGSSIGCMRYIYSGKFTCTCGYTAVVDDGILITPNGYEGEHDKPDVSRELYKDLPPALISLFQRSYNWMKDQLRGMDLENKVVMETYINAWFFFHNHQQYFSKTGRYIIVDKYPETLRMYKELIEKENYDLDILYIADASTNFPITKGCVDLNLDFFAVNEHNFYHGHRLWIRICAVTQVLKYGPAMKISGYS